MDIKYKISCALTVLSIAMVGCSSNKVKVEDVKPNPLPKIAQSASLAQVGSYKVSSTSAEDPLRLTMKSDQGVLFLLDPKGSVSAYKGKQRVWEKEVSKIEINSFMALSASAIEKIKQQQVINLEKRLNSIPMEKETVQEKRNKI